MPPHPIKPTATLSLGGGAPSAPSAAAGRKLGAATAPAAAPRRNERLDTSLRFSIASTSSVAGSRATPPS